MGYRQILAVLLSAAWSCCAAGPAPGFSVMVGADPCQPIPAEGNIGAMEPVELYVADHFSILDLDVYVDIDHTNVCDLELTVTSPGQQSVRLKEAWLPSWHSQQADMKDTIFDDQADVYLPDGEPPYQGRFRPVAGHWLGSFNQQNAQGVWTLAINDQYHGDAGWLRRWELRFEAVSTPEPSVSAVVLLGLGLLWRRRAGG